ncbi:type 1 glutamine amidotransferase domain-containing protein [Methylonatrum kenyense]|uniref:type 1 glutamine amidotransferase domain-containing protein n=1 Tax=Methylonatrum kenyense TaxID=455253 RepID=UPI0020C1045E|nr:type 1 glutamine amidotransferase domain-containing protein [Methylonatrum kenyense]MCK8515806.1 type 1 glutamine amidotransferase domain-containing protein [Methylonatrum kenyense]
MKILMVLTSHDRLGDSGYPTGFWLEEFTSPFYAFRDAGAEITLASPKGGQPPVDPNSEAEEALTESTRRFMNDADAREQLAATRRLADVDIDDFDAVFYPGGHGPLWDLAENRDSISLIRRAHDQGKVIGAVCHAPAVFRHVELDSGRALVAGRNVTGFSNTEEDAVQLTDVVPFLVEDMLKERGGNYSRADDWQAHVVTDGKLVTGQNPASSEDTARAVILALQQG